MMEGKEKEKIREHMENREEEKGVRRERDERKEGN